MQRKCPGDQNHPYHVLTKLSLRTLSIASLSYSAGCCFAKRFCRNDKRAIFLEVTISIKNPPFHFFGCIGLFFYHLILRKAGLEKSIA